MRYFIILSLFFLSVGSYAQELFCDIRVTSPNLQKVDQAVFQTLQNDLTEFMNNRRWTDQRYSQDEKIECSITINITEELSSTKFKGELTVIANRPVFDSNYKTIVFQHKDIDISFNYTQDQPLEYDENSFVNNLTSILGFYAYLVIGFDYDTFSANAGNPYFTKAEQIVNNSQGPAQTNGFEGWQANEGTKRRNRYWIVTQLLDPAFSKLRQAYYTYHRQGLDLMFEDPEDGRTNIITALQQIKTINDRTPNAIALKLFTVSKNNEIIDIFSDASIAPTDKVKVSNLMTKLDPAAASSFRKITSNSNKAGRTSSPRSGRVK